MPNDILYPSNLKITAHHEAGHAVVAKLFTWPVEEMVLYTEPAGNWGGCTYENRPLAKMFGDRIKDFQVDRLKLQVV